MHKPLALAMILFCANGGVRALSIPFAGHAFTPPEIAPMRLAQNDDDQDDDETDGGPVNPDEQVGGPMVGGEAVNPDEQVGGPMIGGDAVNPDEPVGGEPLY